LFSVWMSAFASASQRAKTNVIWTWYKEEFKSRFNFLCQTKEIANTRTHTLTEQDTSFPHKHRILTKGYFEVGLYSEFIKEDKTHQIANNVDHNLCAFGASTGTTPKSLRRLSASKWFGTDDTLLTTPTALQVRHSLSCVSSIAMTKTLSLSTQCECCVLRSRDILLNLIFLR